MRSSKADDIVIFMILVPRPKIGSVEGKMDGITTAGSMIVDWELNVDRVGGLGTGRSLALLGGLSIVTIL